MSTTIETESLTSMHWVAIVLAAITGAIHLGMGIMFFPGVQPISFILAGLGFFGAIVLVLINYRRRELYLLGIPFTALQIVLYLWINQRADPAISPLEAIDKVAQVLLIVILFVLYRRET